MNERILCMICGEPATLKFGGSEVLPLCTLRSCEVALIHEINGTVETATAEVAEEQYV
jgi:hypothetical protein